VFEEKNPRIIGDFGRHTDSRPGHPSSTPTAVSR
jgi:hypothetical protein